MVNNIEKNVSNAAEYICSAKEETKKAVRYQKKSRRVCVSFSLCITNKSLCKCQLYKISKFSDMGPLESAITTCSSLGRNT